MAARVLLATLLLAGICSAATQAFTHDLFDLYLMNDGMIALYAGGVRIGALTDINDVTHIFTEAELNEPASAAPWSMSKEKDKRLVKDAQQTLVAQITEEGSFLGMGHSKFHLKDAAGQEIAEIVKETQSDRTFVRCKVGEKVLAVLSIDGQGSNHGSPTRSQLAILTSEFTADRRTLLLLAARNIFSYIKNRKVISASNMHTWSDVIRVARNYL